jgi:hypothetical protein
MSGPQKPPRYVAVRLTELRKLRAVLAAARPIRDPHRNGLYGYPGDDRRQPVSASRTLVDRSELHALMDAVKRADGKD